MGVVYEVERVTDHERLALKLVTGNVSGPAAARFAREAEIGARVHHDNLVSIVDVGVAEGGAPFLVMELVRGASLESERHRYGDVAWGLPVLRQIAEGLVALHEAGVVHRDLKPSNVLLSDTGAKISDFGISRFGSEGPIDVDGPTLQVSSPKRRDLTGTGAMLGTPLYMAPEAARGGRSTLVPADIFAFGILAHEVLTGRAPFAMPPVLLALAGHAIPVAPPIDVDVSDALRDVIRACLSADPAKRPTAARVRDQLR